MRRIKNLVKRGRHRKSKAPETDSSPISSPSPYRYQPFEDTGGWIRLLEFTPGDDVCFELRHFKLDSAPPYAALSYAWGDRTPSTPIRIGNYELRITESLSIAFAHLRKHVQQKGLLLWADGACINQLDSKERGEQVAQMKSVYETAQCVFAWLGETDGDGDYGHAVAQMRQWDDAQRHRMINIDEYLECIEASDPFYYGDPGSDGYKAWPGILALGMSPWWMRVWVVQEVLLARDLQLFWGPHVMSFGMMVSALNVQEELIQRHDIQTLSSTVSTPHYLSNIRGAYMDEHHKAGFPLLEILFRLRGLRCTNPRDRVYSAIGIASDIKEGDIKPDYSQSVAEVFTSATTFCFDISPPKSKLDFLGYIDHFTTYHHEEDTVLPSWVPDWRSDQVYYPFLKYLDDGFDTRAYNAGGDSKENAHMDGSAFYVRGFLIDVITEVKQISYTQRHEDISIEKSWEPEDLGAKYPSGGDIETAWLHCLVADVRRTWERGTTRGNAICWPKMTPRTWQESDMFSSMKTATYNRRMVSTDKGYLGLGPGTSKVGDKVAIFFGGQMLYIMRQNDEGSYRLIGEAYVHGLMDGEALDEKLFSHTVQTFQII